MKLVITSDTHCGNLSPCEGSEPYTAEKHKELAAKLHAEKPDVLIVTGDCAEGGLGDGPLEMFLDVYKNPHGDSICIPGNHDVWLGPDDYNPNDKYDRFFKIAREKGWIALRDEPYQKDGVWFVGNSCWYDYSLADPACGKSPYDYDQEMKWSDFIYMGFRGAMGRLSGVSETPMLDFCSKRMSEFKAALSKVPVGRKALVTMSHVVGFNRLMGGDFPTPDYPRAFMGNVEIGKLIAEADADYYVCGHTHRRKEFVIGKTKCINNGSGYGYDSKIFDVIEIKTD